MSDRLYTVKDVARMIAFDKSDETIARVMRQIRHWTNNDLLFPVGGKDTGTGVSRVYDADGVRKAGIILELTRYGITVDMVGEETFEEWMSSIVTTKEWKRAIEGKDDFFLQFAWEAGRGSSSRIPTLNRGLLCRSEYLQRTGMRTASEIIVNVTAICKRIGL